MKVFLRSDGTWLIKIAVAVLSLFLTVKFALPVTELTDKGCSLFIMRESTKVTAPAPVTGANEEEEPSSGERDDGTFVYETPSDVKSFEAEYLSTYEKAAVAGSSQSLRDTAAALYSIRPDTESK